MAVDFDYILKSPIIQYVFVDKIAAGLPPQLAAGASVYFYKTDEITPKNIYIATGDPQNPYIVASNPQILNAGGAFEQTIYLYLYDESDDEPTNEELYFVQVINTNGEIIFEENDFPSKISDASINTSTSFNNLSPSYAYDVPNPINVEYEGQPYLSNVADYPALGYVWVKTEPTSSDFSYDFVETTTDDLDGDPWNYLILNAENFGSSQTNIFFGFPICLYPELIGQQINLQFLAQDQSSNPVTSLDISVIRGPAPTGSGSEPRIDWDTSLSPINVGTVNLDTSFGTKNLTFDMPDLATSPTDGSFTYILIELPKDQAFSIALTGWIVYVGDTLTSVTHVVKNLGTRLSGQFFQLMNNYLLNDTPPDSNRLPMMKDRNQGAINYQTRTGAIFSSLSGKQNNFNFAIELLGQSACYGYPYNYFNDQNSPGGEILGNRMFLNFPELIQASYDSFLVDNVTATSFDVQTNGGSSYHSDWVSNSAAIVITSTGGPSSYPITAVVNGVDPNTVDMTFTSNYDAFGQPTISSTGQSGADSNLPIIQNPPAAGVMINWIGSINASGTPGIVNFSPTAGFVFTTTNNGDAISPATCSLTFPATGVTQASEIQTGQPYSFGNEYMYNNYLPFNDEDTAIIQNNISSLLPPYAIQFHVDGNGTDIPVTNRLININFVTADLASGVLMAQKMVDQITQTLIYTLTFSAVPSNGDSVLFSNEKDDFIFVFWITNQARPANPVPSPAALYVEISPSDTIVEVIATMQDLFTNRVGALPTQRDIQVLNYPSDLGLYVEV